MTATEAAVLGLLVRYGERSGYDLNRIAQRGVGYVWAPARSRIYATLPRPVEAGHAVSRRVAQTRRPDKELYRVTADGDAALRTWLARLEPGSTDTFLLRVFFGDLMPGAVLVAHVAQHRADAAARLAEYEEIERRIRERPDDRFGYLTLRWGLAAARARLAWADEALAELRAHDEVDR